LSGGLSPQNPNFAHGHTYSFLTRKFSLIYACATTLYILHHNLGIHSWSDGYTSRRRALASVSSGSFDFFSSSSYYCYFIAPAKTRAHTTDTFPVFNFRFDRDRVNVIIICRFKSVTIGQVDLKENYNICNKSVVSLRRDK